jgi:hypothetical protein
VRVEAMFASPGEQSRSNIRVVVDQEHPLGPLLSESQLLASQENGVPFVHYFEKFLRVWFVGD